MARVIKMILYFLCGTAGKTTLSIQKKINGDDEHGWTSENTVFNFERKAYFIVINLSSGYL
jgi:phosphoenolpyruvate carboxykinase (ATP)